MARYIHAPTPVDAFEVTVDTSCGNKDRYSEMHAVSDTYPWFDWALIEGGTPPLGSGGFYVRPYRDRQTDMTAWQPFKTGDWIVHDTEDGSVSVLDSIEFDGLYDKDEEA